MCLVMTVLFRYYFRNLQTLKILTSTKNKPAVTSVSQLNLLKPTGHVMHHQFNIQQFYALPTLYLVVLYLHKKKQLLLPNTA
jgi:hypothetical protein